MKTLNNLYAPVLILSALATHALASGVLDLETYIDQVQDRHEGFKAARSIREATQSRSTESELLTLPRLSAQIQSVIDERPQVQPAFLGTRTTDQLYRISVDQATSFGTTARLGYQFNYRQIDGVNAQFVPRNSFYLGTPTLELSQQLLKNGFGSEIRAQKEVGRAAAQASSFEQSYRARGILVEARAAYWRAAVAQKIVDAQKLLLQRARKMADWSNRRVRLQLADRADSIQADALVKVRQLELQNAEDELKNAARLLNSLRNAPVSKLDTLEEALQGLDAPIVESSLGEVERKLSAPMRDDVKQAQELSKLASAQAILGEEKNRSQLEVYGAYALNSLEPDATRGWQNSWSTSNPTTTLGVRFATPLDFSLASKTKEAYLKESVAAESVYQRRLIDQQREAQELAFQIRAANQRVRLLKEIEETQEQKLNNERERLYKGRSTTFQVLQFEQDASLAQVNLIRTQGELKTLLARTELYKEGSTP